MKKIAFLSNGCQGSLCKPREIIAADPDQYCEVSDPKTADILMVNFCAISAESLADFNKFRREIIGYKKSNPRLKIIAGGCVEGLSKKADLSFADAIFHHREEAAVLAAFLGKPAHAPLSPVFLNGSAYIHIAQGCNNHCTFCKVHYLNYMQLTSRPMAEILDLARQAISKGHHIITLAAENSTEYGQDIGTNLQTLLEQLLALDGLRLLDIYGACLDEVTSDLLQLFQHPKIRVIQLEAQSLDDGIRKKMGLHKSTSEVLDILDALSGKFLISNFITGFPGHSIAEFNREMRKIRSHHLYFLTLDPYDDTPGAPSHKFYQPIDPATEKYYKETFIRTIAKERQLLFELLLHQPSIEASIVSVNHAKILLHASHYSLEIEANQPFHHYHPGDIVRVKITDLLNRMPDKLQQALSRPGNDQQFLLTMQYFSLIDKFQILPVKGEIIGPA